ncbi:hypothetical protein B0H11DRAFT_2312873 [Mycena galericulata]|nr:hypothetical protein B0H11DRAFT_2312873 [Mycena galericulata]
MTLQRRTLLLLLPFLLYVCRTSSAPLEGRVDTPCPAGPPTLKVLVQSSNSPTSEPSTAATGASAQVCTQDQIDYLQQGLTDAGTLASSGAAKLGNADAIQSAVVKTYLGKITAEALQNIVRLRYKNVQESLTSATLTQVDTIDQSGTDTSVYFLCGTGANEPSDCTQSSSTSDAFTLNLGDKDDSDVMFSSITLCPNFFNGTPLEADVDSYNANKAKKPNGLNTFAPPRSAGVVSKTFFVQGKVTDSSIKIILHESQHCLAILQSSVPTDNVQDITGLSAPSGFTPGKAASKKQDNAESYALLGFLAYADGDLFTPKKKRASE